MLEQQAAMAMVFPADRVVYDDEPTRAAKLVVNPAEYERSTHRFDRDGPAAHYWSAQWLAFRPGRYYDGLAFAGGWRTAAGRPRIAFVCTDLSWEFGDRRTAMIFANLYVPAGWRVGSRIVYPRHVTHLYFRLNPG